MKYTACYGVNFSMVFLPFVKICATYMYLFNGYFFIHSVRQLTVWKIVINPKYVENKGFVLCGKKKAEHVC